MSTLQGRVTCSPSAAVWSGGSLTNFWMMEEVEEVEERPPTRRLESSAGASTSMATVTWDLGSVTSGYEVNQCNVLTQPGSIKK